MPDLALALASRERSDYADSVGFIRVKEKRDLLNHARLQEYLFSSQEAILERLRQTAGREPETGDHPLEGLLGTLLREDYAAVERYDHHGLVVPLLRYRHDVFHLRSLLRRRAYGLPLIPSPVPGNHSLQELEDHLFQGRPLALPAALGEALAGLRQHLEVQQYDDRVDLVLDLAWIRLGVEFAAARRMPLLTHYFLCLEDFATLKLLWRRVAAVRYGFASHHLSPRVHYLDPAILRAHDPERIADLVLKSVYGPALKEGLADWRTTGSWMLLERDLDNFLLGELTTARYLSMGPEPLFSYLVARESDLKTIRTIFVLKGAGWADAELRRHMRRLYV